MKSIVALLKSSVLLTAAVGFLGAGTVEHAQAFDLEPNGEWNSGTIFPNSAANDPASWDFIVPEGFQSAFDVVDQFDPGDIYSIFNGTTLVGTTNFVPKTPPFVYLPSGDPGLDAAWANASPFSSASLLFGPGTFSLTLASAAGSLPAGYSARLNQAETPIPEPFTVVGTLIGGAAAWSMRKKLKASSQVSAKATLDSQD